MATDTKSNIALRSPQGVASTVDRFLASMDWNGCGNYRRECVAHWTKLFATDEVVYNEPIIQNVLSFIDHMSCCADTYVSLGGSNGCADQLTNWDGTQKLGLGAPSKKETTRFIQIMTMRGGFCIGYCKSPQIIEMQCQK